jgi:peptidyl-prolyl cis-trans isomerase D
MNDKEINTLNKIFFSEDKVAINIITDNNIDTTYGEESLKKYWEANKDNYKTKTKLKINVEKIAIGEDEKVSKNEALKKYLALKNNKEKFAIEELINENETKFGAEIANIINLKAGETIKPFKINNEFIIVRMVEKIAPKTLSFEEVKGNIAADYKKTLVKEKLEEKRNALLKNFTGESLGYINRENPPSIASLSDAQRDKLVEDIFSSKTLINATSFEDKIVVFKIEDTRLGNFDGEKNEILKQNIEKIKNDGVIMSLLTKLQKEYETKSNMKVE